jgi:nicotinate-nucleotide adenylyltransferase
VIFSRVVTGFNVAMEAASTGITRLGMLGGAFDPPHRAHFALAQAAVAQLNLDQLRVVPTGQAWHKSRQISDSQHRLAMCALGFQGLDRTVIDARETLRKGATFTFDTLQEFRQEFPLAQLFLILGEDQARTFTNWHRWEEISKIAMIFIAKRAYNTLATAVFEQNLLKIPAFHQLDVPLSPLSATDIRQRVANHKNISSLVFDSVARYIEQHHLYLTS